MCVVVWYPFTVVLLSCLQPILTTMEYIEIVLSALRSIYVYIHTIHRRSIKLARSDDIMVSTVQYYTLSECPSEW